MTFYENVFMFFSKTTAQIYKNFHSFGIITCLLQPAVKNTAAVKNTCAWDHEDHISFIRLINPLTFNSLELGTESSY